MMNRISLLLSLFALLFVSVNSPETAYGYKAYTTYSQGSVVPPSCTKEQPRKLRWTVNTIGYWLENAPLSNPIAAENASHQSFSKWDAVPGCNQPIFQFMGLTEDPSQGGTMPPVGYDPNQEDKNQNIVLWVTDSSQWTHEPGILALTRLTFGACSGLIYDADIEINAADFTFSADPTPPDGTIDLENTLTHEIGHFLGLDHSYDFHATMFPQAPEAETSKRDLDEDDINGLCCLYGDGNPIVLPEGICEGAPPRSETEPQSEGGGGGGQALSEDGCSHGPIQDVFPFSLLLFTLLLLRKKPPTEQH